MIKDFNYTFNSTKKAIGFKLENESYTTEQVNRLLNAVCASIDHMLSQNNVKELSDG